MVGAEGRTQQPRQLPEQWLLGGDVPVVERVDMVAVLHEGPRPGADEIAFGAQRQAGLARVARGGEPPAQRVRQPALGPEVDHAADTVGVALLHHRHVEVHRRPPARQVRRVAQHLGDLIASGLHPPLRDEVILGAHR